MKGKIIVLSLLVLVGATLAQAQTKISGTAHCGKADKEYAIEIGDRPGHSFVISQVKCTWAKPWEIEGIQNKEGVGTDFYEVTGESSRFRGYFVDTMANGDKAYYPYRGMATLKKGVIETAEEKWTLIGGTGKLKGVKGQGTCKGKGGPDGSSTWECEGEYQRAK